MTAGEKLKPGAQQPPLPKGAGDESIARLEKLRHSSGPLSTFQIRNKMQRIMQVGTPEAQLRSYHHPIQPDLISLFYSVCPSPGPSCCDHGKMKRVIFGHVCE